MKFPTSFGIKRKTAAPTAHSSITDTGIVPLPKARLIITLVTVNTAAQPTFRKPENSPAISPPNANAPQRKPC